MVKTQDPTDQQIPIPLSDSRRRYGDWYYDSGRIYSCRFSTDGKEIVAGGGKGTLFVFDLEAMRRTLSIEAHDDDINSCCWADTSSGNVLVSASDDTSLKVWDRRSLGASRRPSGVLIGHTEGITHVAPKGDGRYVISNGKDQVGLHLLLMSGCLLLKVDDSAVGLAKDADTSGMERSQPVRPR